MPHGRESCRNRDQARAPHSQHWHQPQTRGTPPLRPKSPPGRLARQGPPEQAAHTSPALRLVPRRLAPPTTSTPREADVYLAALVETKVPFRKGGGRGRPLPSSSGSSLQSGHGAAACGTQRTRSSLSAVRSPPGGPPPLHTASVCGKSQREMKDSLAPCVLKHVHKGKVPP